MEETNQYCLHELLMTGHETNNTSFSVEFWFTLYIYWDRRGTIVLYFD